MCGIMGAFSPSGRSVAADIFTGLKMIQHRGQDSAGIATYDGQKLHLYKGEGLVEDAIPIERLSLLKGYIGIGQVRYPTVGGGGLEDAQPFMTLHPYGILMAHNGNIINFHLLKKEILKKYRRFVNSDCDVESVMHVLAGHLEDEGKLDEESVVSAIRKVYKDIRGSYAVVGVIAGFGMFAFRDPYGIRPMVFGKRGDDIAVSSESVALDIVGYKLERDIKPGELMIIKNNGDISFHIIDERPQKTCIFEWVYFARPDSVMDGISVYEARLRLGEKLADKIPEDVVKEIDVVVPVPDTSRTAALAISKKLNIPLREGLIKNRYIGRTFIMPDQLSRVDAIKQKLNPIKSEIEGKNILLVDDSIVRGNTSGKIIKLLKENGAKKVYMAIYSPPVKYPCYYGIDMQKKDELIASSKSIEEIRQLILADGLFYQTIEDMIEGVGQGRDMFCHGCFSGEYPVPPTSEEIESIEKDRSSVE